MSVLAIDPGAKRLGWAVVERNAFGEPRCPVSGIFHCDRQVGEAYQDYRLRAMREVVGWSETISKTYVFGEVVHETLPVKGFNDMGQAYLALSVISAVAGFFMTVRHPVVQIGATTVKSKIGGSNKATKVRVRNGVWQLIPDLQGRGPNWKKGSKFFDESDAVAIGLAYLGFTRK